MWDQYAIVTTSNIAPTTIVAVVRTSLPSTEIEP
jgi:hypothetical protein